jgi:hypothetical protein
MHTRRDLIACLFSTFDFDGEEFWREVVDVQGPTRAAVLG